MDASANGVCEWNTQKQHRKCPPNTDHGKDKANNHPCDYRATREAYKTKFLKQNNTNSCISGEEW